MLTCKGKCIIDTNPPCVPYEQQQQHHVGVVAGAGDMQGRPQVLVLVVHVQASLDQEFGRKHVVVAGALQNRSILS